MSLKKVGELTIPSRQDYLARVDQYTERIVRDLHLPSQMLDDIAISISEAVNNAIVHGNKLDENKRVVIRYYFCAKYLRLVVRDEGRGFSIKAVPDPRQEQNLLKPSGRGILIMRHLMDRVFFRQLKHGMMIIMDKFRPNAENIPAEKGGTVG